MPTREEVVTMPDGKNYVISRGQILCLETGRPWKKGGYTKKQKRAYMRLRAGATLAIDRKERLQFLTLSTRYDRAAPEKRLSRLKKMNNAFTKLKQQIEWDWQKKIYIRYCKKHHLTPWVKHHNKKTVKYPAIWEKCFVKFRYFKIKTTEGGGVMHIVFRKGYNVPKLDTRWLQRIWGKLWDSPQGTDIHDIPYKDAEKVGFYLVNQYVAGQPFLRCSSSYYWVYQGFTRSFRHIIEVYGYKHALNLWNKMLITQLPDHGRKKRFRWRKPPPKKLGVVGISYTQRTLQTRVDSPKYENIKNGFGQLPPIILTTYSRYPNNPFKSREYTRKRYKNTYLTQTISNAPTKRT